MGDNPNDVVSAATMVPDGFRVRILLKKKFSASAKCFGQRPFLSFCQFLNSGIKLV
jgi:hypothetical protein